MWWNWPQGQLNLHKVESTCNNYGFVGLDGLLLCILEFSFGSNNPHNVMSLSSNKPKPPSISNFPLNPPITWNRRWNFRFYIILFFYWYHSYAKLWSNKQELSEQAVEQIYFILISYASNKSSSSWSSFFSLLLSKPSP